MIVWPILAPKHLRGTDIRYGDMGGVCRYRAKVDLPEKAHKLPTSTGRRQRRLSPADLKD
ncbi:hypothetical protein AGR6A_pAt30022 [Agrobacterium sp. NCPPB 925]|nr:hypothetical protein AGR6A_pAt30022 [Agrobacterium sp. NCPPB 925]